MDGMFVVIIALLVICVAAIAMGIFIILREPTQEDTQEKTNKKTPEKPEEKVSEEPEQKPNKIIRTFFFLVGGIGGITGFSFAKAYCDTYGYPVWGYWVLGLIVVAGIVIWIVREIKQDNNADNSKQND